MFKRIKIALFTSMFLLLYSCSTDNPIIAGKTYDVMIKGKLLNKDKTPVVGALVHLKNLNMNTITKSDGSYIIEENINQKYLSKRIAIAEDSTIQDTLLIKVSNELYDTSEVIKEEITIQSGVVIELPTNFIVTREIRGYLSPNDSTLVKNIVAIVFDNSSFPEQKKYIDLWYDKMNSAFHSFAYFLSDTGKNYTLYVNVYDTNDRVIGRSKNFVFPDNAGNIIFKDAFAFNNATPKLNLMLNKKKIYFGDTILFTFNAIDSFGTIQNIVFTNKDTPIATFNPNIDKLDSSFSLIVNSKDFKINADIIDEDGNVNSYLYNYVVLDLPISKRLLGFDVQIDNILPNDSMTVTLITTSSDTFFDHTVVYKYFEIVNGKLLNKYDVKTDSASIVGYGHNPNNFKEYFNLTYTVTRNIPKSDSGYDITIGYIIPKANGYVYDDSGYAKINYNANDTLIKNFKY